MARLAVRRVLPAARQVPAVWLRRLCVAPPSNPDELYRAGMQHLANDDIAAAKALLRRSAEQGHAKAQATIGRIVYDEMEALRRISQAHDYQAASEAHKWLQRASEQGEREATRTLIPLYITKGDLAAALRTTFRWLRDSVWS